jgi:geranylgeranyl reductase family protein
VVYDAAIVGAGPAGARAAWRLARAGATVALIDASHPREKPCGGGVTGRALALLADQLATLPPSARAGVIVENAVFASNRSRACVPLIAGGRHSLSPLVVYSRERFDGWLFNTALAAGATHVADRAREVQLDSSRARVTLAGGNTIEAACLIGADGANSLVRRRALAPFDRSELSIASGYFVRGACSRDIVVEFESDPPGYLWSFPRVDHLAVGVCAQADLSTAPQLRRIAARWIEREAISGSLHAYSWPIPSLPVTSIRRQRPAGPRWLLIGDAAGLVDPITREGIFFALQSADHAVDALQGGGDVARAYCARLEDDIFPELAHAAVLKAGFFRPRFTALLMDALASSSRVRGVMADLVAGSQPYRTLVRRLVETLEFKLAWRLLRLRSQR